MSPLQDKAVKAAYLLEKNPLIASILILPFSCFVVYVIMALFFAFFQFSHDPIAEYGKDILYVSGISMSVFTVCAWFFGGALLWYRIGKNTSES